MGIENLHFYSSTVTWCTLSFEKHCAESLLPSWLPVKWGSMNTGRCRFLAWGKPFRGHEPPGLYNEQGIRPPSCLKTRSSRWPFCPFKFKCFKKDWPIFQGSQGSSECKGCVCVCLGVGCWCSSLFYASLFSHLCSYHCVLNPLIISWENWLIIFWFVYLLEHIKEPKISDSLPWGFRKQQINQKLVDITRILLSKQFCFWWEPVMIIVVDSRQATKKYTQLLVCLSFYLQKSYLISTEISFYFPSTLLQQTPQFLGLPSHLVPHNFSPLISLHL